MPDCYEIPTAWLFRAEASNGRGWGHTQADTVDKVSAASMQEASVATSRLLCRLATAHAPLPFSHRPVADVQEIMEASGMREVARFEDRWPFGE